MKAALHDGKGTMQLKDMNRPSLEDRDVLIRVKATGICGSDLLDYSHLVTVPGGHEVAGEIVEVGSSIDVSRLGERVAIETIGQGLNCKDCWFCRQGEFIHCSNKTSNEGGGFAEYIKRRADGCYPIGKNMNWQDGALVEPLAVSVHGIRRGRMNSGDTVVVLGSGTIGLTTVAAARALGAGKIFVTARHKHQAELAKLLGADEALPPEGALLKEAVLDITGGRGADITLETVGGNSGATIHQSFNITRHMGRIVILGCFFAPVPVDFLQCHVREHNILASICYSVIDGKHDYEVAIDLMDSGRVNLKEMVTHKFALSDIQRGFEIASNKSSGSIKVQIHQ